MVGTILNALAIIVGGVVGLVTKPLSHRAESYWKVILGVFTLFYGLRLTWVSLNGSIWQILKQLLIVILALGLGRWTGSLLNLQKLSNSLGQNARERISNSATGKPAVSEGFNICATLFCAAPIGIYGAVADGLSEYWYPLAVKAVIDGLTAMGLARLFGWSVAMAALPVLAFQGTITLVCSEWLGPFLRQHHLVDIINATDGLLIFCVSLVVLQIKKVALADYFPSLVFAGLIGAWVR